MVKYNFVGFFAIGFGATMTNTDMIIIEIRSNNVVKIKDSYSDSTGTLVDSQQDVTLLGYTVTTD